jgi:hypothetical protein
VKSRADITLQPPATVKLDLRVQPAAAPPRRTVQPAPAPGRRTSPTDSVTAGSWWTARARAGEVAPGFSRDEILKPTKEDPRAENGIFPRVGGLLRELSSGGSIG